MVRPACSAHEVPHSPAYDSDEALEDPQARAPARSRSARRRQSSAPSPRCVPPYNFDGARRACEVLPPPVLDEHGAEIREELRRRKAG